MTSQIPNLERARRNASEWLADLNERGHFADEQLALATLRAVLQTLRDRLTVDEAADLGAQLPVVIRGIYYEGYRPATMPRDHETRAEFLEAVRERLFDVRAVNAERAVAAVFELLEERISEGEIRQVRDQLPEEIAELWAVTA